MDSHTFSSAVDGITERVELFEDFVNKELQAVRSKIDSFGKVVESKISDNNRKSRERIDLFDKKVTSLSLENKELKEAIQELMDQMKALVVLVRSNTTKDDLPSSSYTSNHQDSVVTTNLIKTPLDGTVPLQSIDSIATEGTPANAVPVSSQYHRTDPMQPLDDLIPKQDHVVSSQAHRESAMLQSLLEESLSKAKSSRRSSAPPAASTLPFHAQPAHSLSIETRSKDGYEPISHFPSTDIPSLKPSPKPSFARKISETLRSAANVFSSTHETPPPSTARSSASSMSSDSYDLVQSWTSKASSGTLKSLEVKSSELSPSHGVVTAASKRAHLLRQISGQLKNLQDESSKEDTTSAVVVPESVPVTDDNFEIDPESQFDISDFGGGPPPSTSRQKAMDKQTSNDELDAKMLARAISVTLHKKSGSYGFLFDIDDRGYVIVVHLQKSGSAALSGKIKVFDILLKVEHVFLKGMSHKTVSSVLADMGTDADFFVVAGDVASPETTMEFEDPPPSLSTLQKSIENALAKAATDASGPVKSEDASPAKAAEHSPAKDGQSSRRVSFSALPLRETSLPAIVPERLTFHVIRKPSQKLGMILEENPRGIVLKELASYSLFHDMQSLRVGDQIMAVNRIDFTTLNKAEADRVLDKLGAMIEITVNRVHPRSSHSSTSLIPHTGKEKDVTQLPIISNAIKQSPITNTDGDARSRAMSSSSERGGKGPSKALSTSSIDKSGRESDIARDNPASISEMPRLKGAAPAASPSRDTDVSGRRKGSTDSGATQTPSSGSLGPTDHISSSPVSTLRHVSNPAGTSPTTYF